MYINISLQIGFYAKNEENFLFYINFRKFVISINFIISRRQYDMIWDVWSCQVVTVFAQYKSFAVCTHEISIWRHVKNTDKQCRVVRIRLRHQIKYENVWRKFMHSCDWEVDSVSKHYISSRVSWWMALQYVR